MQDSLVSNFILAIEILLLSMVISKIKKMSIYLWNFAQMVNCFKCLGKIEGWKRLMSVRLSDKFVRVWIMSIKKRLYIAMLSLKIFYSILYTWIYSGNSKNKWLWMGCALWKWNAKDGLRLTSLLFTLDCFINSLRLEDRPVGDWNDDLLMFVRKDSF